MFGYCALSFVGIRSFVGLNAILYGAWQYSSFTDNNGELSDTQIQVQQYLWNNWTNSIRNTRRRRWWTWLTSAVCHSSFLQLAINMNNFLMISGLLLQQRLSPMAIAVVSVGSALSSSSQSSCLCITFRMLAHIPRGFFLASQADCLKANDLQVWQKHDIERAPAQGAGALVSGLIVFAALRSRPSHTVHFLVPFGVVPMPLWLFSTLR